MIKPLRANGFTLIEVIVGIVVLAIALTLITSIIVPTARQSVTPVYQMRAAELGQAWLSDIASRSFIELDDYHQIDEIIGTVEEEVNALPTDIGVDIYRNFRLQATVLPSSHCVPARCKDITVIITTPEGQAFTFTTVRGDF